MLLVLAAAYCGLQAFVRPFWFDEIFTVLIARTPSVGDLWRSLLDGVDGNPPLFYLIGRALHQVVPDEHIAFRLPSVAGFVATLLCVYAVLSFRLKRLPALIGTAFLMSTVLLNYASEARAYSLMVAFIALAMFAWQRTDRSRLFPALMATALALAVSVHYYAVLAWPAFALAEAAEWWSRGRRLRLSVWAALAAGTAPLLIYYQHLVAFRRAFGQAFWAKASREDLLTAHDWLFSVRSSWGLILAIAIVAFCLLTCRRGDPAARERRFPLSECVLACALLSIPLIGYALAKLTGGGMTHRYMLTAVLGGALGVGYLTSALPERAQRVLVLLVAFNFLVNTLPSVAWVARKSVLWQRANAASALNAVDPQLDLPLVVSSGHEYLKFAYYAPRPISHRLYHLTDPAAAREYAESDTVDISLTLLQRHTGLQVQDYRQFASRFREFILIEGREQVWGWWPRRLSRDGHSLQLLSDDGTTKVYRVTLRP